MNPHIIMLGGYAAGGGVRDPDMHPSIIDGTGSGRTLTAASDDNIRIDGFTFHSGRGISITYSDDVHISQCVFSNNTGTYGVLYGYRSGIDVTHCHFSNNTAAKGAALYCSNTYMTLTNCLITGNDASDDGGGLFIRSSHVNMTSSTLADNTSGTRRRRNQL